MNAARVLLPPEMRDAISDAMRRAWPTRRALMRFALGRVLACMAILCRLEGIDGVH
jgi:hypothetical protein